jgi:ATP adenylyltransferase
MNPIFAPWRMTWIATADQQTPQCIFCAFPAQGPVRAREHLILCVQPHAFVMLNKYPYTSGHLLVVPRRHVARPEALDPVEWIATNELLRWAIVRLGEGVGASQYNVGMNLGRDAGAGIADHMHWHVVPRWAGDHNFMPLLDDTRVVSEYLDTTYERLRPHFAPLGEPVSR